MKSHLNIFLIFWVIFYLYPPTIIAQDGLSLFKKNCSSCHTIGGGKLVGPDLAGITGKVDKAWIKKFIRNSAEMIGSGDPTAVAVSTEFNRLPMPPFAGSESDIDAIIGYLDKSAGVHAKVPARDTFLLAAKEENTLMGKDLFTGRTAFQNRGPSCISCHSVQGINGMGGFLAKSLNFSYFILKGQGIHALLQAPAFPAMANAYQDHPLKEDEIYNVASFLKSTSLGMWKQNIHESNSRFFILGAIGWFICFAILYGLWVRRKRKSVNNEIFLRQLRTTRSS